MSTNSPTLPTTRREFLKTSATGIGLLAFTRFAPSFLVQSALAGTPTPEKDKTILVLVQLAGGNDGLNTVIPFEDSNYYRLRPTIGIKKSDALKLSDTLGLHPSMHHLHQLIQNGKASIIQNVGYPNPNRSHFRSTEIWETGSSSNEFLSTGWIGRYLDNTCNGQPNDSEGGARSPSAPSTSSPRGDKSPPQESYSLAATRYSLLGESPLAIHLGNELPQTFFSETSHPTFGLSTQGGKQRSARNNLQLLETLIQQPAPASEAADVNFLKATMMNALVTERKFQEILSKYRPASAYPENNFAQSLRNIVALIAAGISTRIYFVTLGGFDTHANQLQTQQNLLGTLSSGLAAFQRDIDSHNLGSQVLTMTFSEFGRRPAENESKGTDHGTAAPLFIMGDRVKSPLHGTSPNLALDRKQDLTFTTDFRQIYSTLLTQWLNTPAPQSILHATYPPLPILS